MTDDYGTSGKVLQALFQGAHGVHVNVVSGLVKQQDIGFALQCQCQMQTVALTTTQHAGLLALVGAGEVESRQIGTCIHQPSAHGDKLVALRHYVVDTLLGVNLHMLLVHIAYLYGLAHGEGTGVGFLQSHD